MFYWDGQLSRFDCNILRNKLSQCFGNVLKFPLIIPRKAILEFTEIKPNRQVINHTFLVFKYCIYRAKENKKFFSLLYNKRKNAHLLFLMIFKCLMSDISDVYFWLFLRCFTREKNITFLFKIFVFLKSFQGISTFKLHIEEVNFDFYRESFFFISSTDKKILAKSLE